MTPLNSLAPLLLLAAAVEAEQPQPTFRSRADLVQVDVVVVDKDGQPVHGLKASDFALLDRRKPQAIAAFEEVAHKRRRPDAPALEAIPATVKRDVASNQTSQANRLIVLVIDDLHIYRGRSDRVKAIASTVIHDLGAEASMAVLFTSGERSTQVTEASRGAQLLPFSPTLDREFAASDTLRLYFRGAGRSPAAAVRTLVEILDARNKSVASYTPASGGATDLEIPLKPLPAGAYSLRVTIADDQHAATRDVGFVIR